MAPSVHLSCAGHAVHGPQAAASSCRAPAWWCLPRQPASQASWPARRGDAGAGAAGWSGVCRVTNEGTEMKVVKPVEYDPEEWMEIDPEYQVPNPELGPLQKRVSKTYLEALEETKISVPDTKYWFTEPPGGWNQEVRLERKAKAVPSRIACARNEGAGRTTVAELAEGQVVTGEVTRIMLYHGAQVDFGAEWDGLVPIKEYEWYDVQDDLQVGQQIQARIWKLRDTDLARWPVQLELLSPNLADRITAPEDYEATYDLRGGPRGVRDPAAWFQELQERTGRPYRPMQRYLDVQPSHAEQAVMEDEAGDEMVGWSGEYEEAWSLRVQERVEDLIMGYDEGGGQYDFRGEDDIE